jgi:FkbM family methyltransferase
VKYYSQAGQDAFVYETFFRGKGPGVFVDVGAYDGEKFSNTKFFEETLGWTGLCIEPLPAAFERLQARRKAPAVACAVSDYCGEGDFLDVDVMVDEKMLSGLVDNYDPRHLQRIARVRQGERRRRTPVKTLAALLDEHGIKEVDYCSIDTEGSELKILQAFDFDRFDVKIFDVENNYHDPKIGELLAAHGYERVHVFEGFDELYARKGLARAAKTTVFCAVWHGDPGRAELLRGHARTLDRQSRPVERVYVFDGGDTPPAGLEGQVIVAREPLTIYEAWNLAISAVRTPYIMNLNLDDRLAPDAVEKLESTLEREGATIVGGDWRVCYDQASTDATSPCAEAGAVPFVGEWPPPAGTVTRLGSGTGQRSTLGPATLWRTDAHRLFPRFPHRFGDGSPIRVIGDAVFWLLLANVAKKKVTRLPAIVGNYHSHPESQAEFRASSADEERKLEQVGIAVV